MSDEEVKTPDYGDQALHPRQLSKPQQKKLLELTAAVFGEDDQARERAALELVDLGPAGARAVAKVLQDAELRKHRKGMWALLHTLADVLSLDIPEDLELELVEAVQVFLATLEDNVEFVAWMAADALTDHYLGGGAREPVRDRIYQGFREGRSNASPVAQLAAVYGLAAIGTDEARVDLVEMEDMASDAAVVEYLKASLARLKGGEAPQVFDAFSTAS